MKRLALTLFLIACPALGQTVVAPQQPVRATFLASAARVASGTGDIGGAAVTLPACSRLYTVLNITAASGTTPTLDVWIQGSADGLTWADLPYDTALINSTAAGDVTASTGRRNINGTTSAVAVGTFIAGYLTTVFPAYRVEWVIGGTTPSFTFDVKAICR